MTSAIYWQSDITSGLNSWCWWLRFLSRTFGGIVSRTFETRDIEEARPSWIVIAKTSWLLSFAIEGIEAIAGHPGRDKPRSRWYGLCCDRGGAARRDFMGGLFTMSRFGTGLRRGVGENEFDDKGV